MRFACKTMLVGLLALVVALGLAPAKAAEGHSESELGVMVGAGAADKKLVGDDWANSPNWAAALRFGHTLSDSLALFTDLSYSEYRGDAALFGNVKDTTLRGGVEWGFGQSWMPYVAPAIGLSNFSAGSGRNALRPILGLGLGIKHPFAATGSFRAEIRGARTFWDSGLGGENFTTLQALVGFGWGVGGPPKDTDGDGVADRADKCPNTPHGAIVDEKGCPKDSDGDGVWDGIDQCPGTAAGVPVDDKGCPKDADGDGVHDGIDKCPDTPKGAKVDAAGCPIDSDGDGVWDGIDQCPNTTKGCKVDARGCPMDADRDGVCDGLDQCPGTPAGAKVDATGCPLPEEKPKAAPLFTPEKKSLVLEGVNFEVNSAKLTESSSATLDKVAASLVDWPEVKVEIGGHTDSDGADAYNQKLSQARAESVKAYLAAKGVDAARMTAKGYGEKKPIADNKTKDGKAKNRRVELTQAN